MIVYDRFVIQPGPLIEEYARQASVSTDNFGEALAQLLTPHGTLPVPPATDRGTWDRSSGAIDAASLDRLLRLADSERGTAWQVPLACIETAIATPGNKLSSPGRSD